MFCCVTNTCCVKRVALATIGLFVFSSCGISAKPTAPSNLYSTGHASDADGNSNESSDAEKNGATGAILSEGTSTPVSGTVSITPTPTPPTTTTEEPPVVTPPVRTCGIGGTLSEDACWYKGSPGASCTTTCTSRGGTDDAKGAWAAASNTNCEAIHDVMGNPRYVHDTLIFSSGRAIGCFIYNSNQRFRENYFGYTAEASHLSLYERICACLN